MRRHVSRNIWLFLIGGACLLASLLPAEAAPVFARKYGFACTMCHSSFPRLNDFGQRYRDNGYRLPGREDDEQTVFKGPAPLSARTSAGYNRDRFTHTPDARDVNQFQINNLDLLSAGLLGRNIGYFLIYVPEISASHGVAGQQGTLEMANVIFSDLGGAPLSIRVGRFEGGWLPFSAKRLLTLSPYEVYDQAGPGGLALSDTQTGVEIAGHTRDGFRYAAGWVDGSGTNDTSDSPSDFYVRAAKIFGEGEGQTAGQRLGAFAYFGRARPTDPAVPDQSRQSVTRWGVDAALNTREWNFEAQWLQGSDDGALWDSMQDYDFTGGFVQAMYLPNTRWVGVARYDFVNTPDAAAGDVGRWTVAGRYYFTDSVALHLEYSHRQQQVNAGPDATEEFLTTRVDWGF